MPPGVADLGSPGFRGRQSPRGPRATLRWPCAETLVCSGAPRAPAVTRSWTHPGMFGGFGLVSFPGPTPDVVLLENLSRATYVEGDGAQPFAHAVERIRAAASSVEDTLARITKLEEGHRK
ncbi:Scr1 family TA system antitoxin-like transcriptional regulator [Streptomyces mobaraensis]